jgi:hypothetical protein
VTNKTPAGGADILRASANNLYDDVQMTDLDGFAESTASTRGSRRTTAGWSKRSTG